jgi:DNA recombination protein RmuC
MGTVFPTLADLAAMLPSIAVLAAFVLVAGCCLHISHRVGQTVSPASRALQQRFAELEAAVARAERDLRQSLERHREANAKEAKRLLDEGVRAAEAQARDVRRGLDDFGERLNGARLDFARDAARVREEVQGAVAGLEASTRQETREFGRRQGEALAGISAEIRALGAESERRQERAMAALEAMRAGLEAAWAGSAGELRERVAADLGEARAMLARLSQTIAGQGADVAEAIAGQRTQLDGVEQTLKTALRESAGSQAALSAAIEGKQVALHAAITARQDALGTAIESRHDSLGAVLQEKQDALNVAVATQFAKFRDEASAQLAQLLAVDERLESSWGLLKGDFDAVTRSLVQISRAIDVLKNELTVKLDDGGKAAGVDGLLGRVLQPTEYERDVEIEPGSNQRVAFAVKLSDNPVTRVWLPIGTLPVVRGYNELVAATVYRDVDAMKSSSEAFERSILEAAEEFSARFVSPPRTPNLAVLVAPSDDLFDEIVRRDSLVDAVGRDFHVLIAGPATLPTLLTALRMAFRGTSAGRAATQPNGPRGRALAGGRAANGDLEPTAPE